MPSFYKAAESVIALIHSREMASFLSSSRDVVLDMTGLALHGAGIAVHVACLPVTGPLHLMGSATDLVVGTCTHAVLSSLSMVNDVLTIGEGSESFSPVDALVHHVMHAVPNVLHAVDAIKNDIGGTLLGLVFPLLGGAQQPKQDINNSCSAGESSSEKEAFLDRLRIDPSTSIEEEVTEGKVLASDYSKFLLRVDDINLMAEGGNRMLYVDLSPDFDDEKLSARALEALLVEGGALVSIGTDKVQSRYAGAIDWKPEGSTHKLRKKKESMPATKWYALMEREVLVWSGTFNCGDYRDRDFPLFLSRGVVPGSPREMFELFWDSTRTTEYNRFCLGRSDAFEIEKLNDPSHEGKVKAIKVVKSETRVPFTSMSVCMSTLMYGCQLDDDLVETYLIVGRSLVSGGAGCHLDYKRVEREGKNEITWGVNLIRAVPGKPGVTDLINISQVCSSFVPRFLTHRVGIMATDNSFQALRSRELAAPEL